MALIQAARLLGFAFTNADVLLEIRLDGEILFAAGAAQGLLDCEPHHLVGTCAFALFAGNDAASFASCLASLPEGQRAGPLQFRIAAGRTAQLCLFKLPNNDGRVSCTLSRPGVHLPDVAAGRDTATGLPTRDAFVATLQQLATDTDYLALFDIPGLSSVVATLGPRESQVLLRNIGSELLASGVKSAGKLSETSFGAIADNRLGQADLARRIKGALEASGAGEFTIDSASLSLAGGDLTPDQRLMALRHVIGRFAAHDKTLPRGSLTEIFDHVMDETVSRLKAFTSMVADGAFSFAYQPIRRITGNGPSHFEALVRFPQEASTGETVQFAEQLGVSDAFDLVVAQKVLSVIETAQDRTLQIAFNISGRMIDAPESFALLQGLLARKRGLSSRTLVEVTETAEITDLEHANRALATLRGLGFRVGIDDFGVGAASLNYLRALQVDFVKFDGSLITRLGTSQHEDALVAGLVKLCAELGLETIAECIETEDMLERVKRMGFDLGQGYHLGKPGQLPAPEIAAPSMFARRRGVRESWG